ISGTKKPRTRPSARLFYSLQLQWTQVDFYPAVLCATGFIGIAGYRLIRAGAIRGQPRSRNAIGAQVRCDALRTAVGEVLVQLQRAGAVGMADDVHTVLIELLEHRNQRIEGWIKAAGNIRRVAGEGDIARHDQLQIIAIALHLHASALQGLAQLGFLGVDVIAVATTGRTTDCSADQGTFAAILLARCGRTNHRTSHCANTTIDARFACLALTGIGVGGTAGEYAKTEGNNSQISPQLHAYFL